MSNPWFRFYSEFAHDPKVQMMTEAMQRRLVMLLCLRCSNALVTLHETEIAFHLRISDAELAETKALFVSKGFIDDEWNVPNWDKRQFKSDSSAERVARHRENKKQASNGDVTLQVTNGNALEQNRTDTDTDTEQKIKTKSAPATRLPADWRPSDADVEFLINTRPELNVHLVADGFRDYWIAQPGAKGRKADWPATWRNWIRNQRQGQARASPYESEKDRGRREVFEVLCGGKQDEPVANERDITGIAERVG